MFNVDTIIFINIIGGLYLIGCLFSYARCLADFGQIDIDYAMLEPSQPDKFVYFTALMSWFGFLIGSIMYLDRRFNEPFFRWNVNDIWSFHIHIPSKKWLIKPSV